MTIFSQILKGEVPCEKVYEDETVFAFKDIHPAAPTHVLIIPKKPVAQVSELKEEDTLLAGQLLQAARFIAQKLQIEHYRLVVNNGEKAGQSVFHLHVHLLAGRPLQWPPG